jgi:hypothetical protein
MDISEFLYNKRDYSHLLVHLTKRSNEEFSAKEILSFILDEHILRAYNAWCIWNKDLNESNNAVLREKFKVVCFTETPIDQIGIILKPLSGRLYQPEPYGLVFEKEYIRTKEGNPVFYVTREIAKPLSKIYSDQKQQADDKICRLLALFTFCDKRNDWHWEREWRIVGNLDFEPEKVYCGLCPEKDIPYFYKKYEPVKFIDPRWGSKRILDELVKQEPPF